MSYRTQQLATFSRLGAVIPVRESDSLWEDLKTSKSASYLSVRSYLVSFDTGSIETHHETFFELSSLLGDDVFTPRIISTGVREVSALGRETV